MDLVVPFRLGEGFRQIGHQVPFTIIRGQLREYRTRREVRAVGFYPEGLVVSRSCDDGG